MCLAPLIGVRGGVAGDFTVTCLAPDHYMMFGSGMAERYHQRFFKQVPLPGGTVFRSLSDAWAGFSVAGPASREVLSTLTGESLLNADFPFMRSRQMQLAGVEVLALRVSFAGELGWEFYCEEAHQLALYKALLQAGQAHGIRPVGGTVLW